MLGRILIAIPLLLVGFCAGYFWVQAPTVRSPTVFQPPVDSGSASAQDTVVPDRAAVQASTPAAIPLVYSLAETADINSEFLQSAALYQMAAPLNADGIRRLLDEAKSALDGGDYQGATALLIGRYAELDFAAALDYATNKDGKMQTSWLRAIFHARARIDIDDALQQALTLSKNQQKVAGIAMLRSTTDISRSQRRAIIDELQLPGQLVASAQFDPSEAWREAGDINEPMQRIGAQAQVLMRWGQSDPWAAIDASSEIENEQMLQGVQAQLLALAAADDSQRAMDWLDAQPEGERRDQLMQAIVAQIGISDPDTAEILLARLPEGKREEARISLWMMRSGSDPEGAAEWIAELSRNSDNNSSLSEVSSRASSQVLSYLGATSSEAANRFMAALPQEQRDQLGTSYIHSIAYQNPQRAARWIESQGSDATPDLYQALGSSWAQSNLDAALAYADDMRSGDDRDQMYSGILSTGGVSGDNANDLIGKIDNRTIREQAEKMQALMEQARSAARSGASSEGEKGN